MKNKFFCVNKIFGFLIFLVFGKTNIFSVVEISSITCYYSENVMELVENNLPCRSREPYFIFNTTAPTNVKEFKYLWTPVDISTWPDAVQRLDNPTSITYYSSGTIKVSTITLNVPSEILVKKIYLHAICLDQAGSSSTLNTFTYWYIGISSNPFIEEIYFVDSFNDNGIFYNVPVTSATIDITFKGEVYGGKISTHSIISNPGCIYIIWKYNQRREKKDIIMPYPNINYPNPTVGNQYQYWDDDFRATQKIRLITTLSPSCEYEIVITTNLKDMIGDPLEKEYRYRFFTAINSSSTSNLIQPEDASGSLSKISLLVPIGALSSNRFVTSKILKSTETAVYNSISKLPKFQNLLYFLEIRCLEKSQSEENKVDSIDKTMTLQYNYDDANDDKILDGTDLSVKELSFWKMDDEREVFVKIPSYVDYDKKIVFAYTNSFGIYAVGAKPKFDIEEVVCYPVPWVPESGKTSTGNFSYGITFANLPYNCEICVYTIYGELVRKIDVINNVSGKYQWDGKNDFGEDLASGVYLWVVKTSSEKKVGKLIIVR
jgi:hypothetical protein